MKLYIWELGKMPRPGEPAPTQEELNRRRLAAMKMRKEGKSYQTIGDALGVTATQAYDDVMHHIRKLNRELKEETSELRQLECIRLDGLIELLEPKLATSLDAMETYLKVIARRAKLLGLDAPTVKQVEIDDKRAEAKRLTAAEAWDRMKKLAERMEAAGMPMKAALRQRMDERNPFKPLPDIEAQPVLALPEQTEKE